MKIAIILPSLANRGPIIVARDVVRNIKDAGIQFQVFYFDNVVELEFDCPCEQISFWSPIRFNDYDLIHSHMLRPDAYIWRFRSRIEKAICISTLHQDIFQNLQASYNYLTAVIFEQFWLMLLKRQDAIVTLSNTMKAQYKKKLSGKLITTIYNGRDDQSCQELLVEPADLLAITKLKARYQLMGSLALLTKRKGLHQIIKALPLLPEYAFLIVGDGKEMKNLQKLASDLQVTDRCLFVGYRVNAYRYLKTLDYYIMSSYSEGFPLGMLEAAQFNLPLICTDIPLFRELFSEEEVSFFKPDDTAAFVSAMASARSHKAELSLNASNKVSRFYSITLMANGYRSFYKRLIENKQ